MSQAVQGWDNFLDLCLMTKDKRSLFLLFDLFFTPEERDDFAKRYLIIKEILKKEKTQREISKELQVSIAKVTRGSNELKRVEPQLIDYLRQLMA